jgi:hypothetical protein
MQADGLPRREQMSEEEWEQETYNAVITAITALERVIYFGGLVTVPNLHNDRSLLTLAWFTKCADIHMTRFRL